MKKIIKNKLFFESDCLKNLFVVEINNEDGVAYEIIEEVKGNHISREILLGWYGRKVKALAEFRRLVKMEAESLVVKTTPARIAFI